MEAHKCEECEKLQPEHYCEICQEFMCSQCDKAIHSKGKRQHHFRVLICEYCSKVSNFYCSTCMSYICTSCISDHSNHKHTPISLQYPTVIYWDLSIYSPDPHVFNQAYDNLKAKYAKLSKIKILGKNPEVLEKIRKSPIIEFLETEGDMRAVFIDISLLYQYTGHFVIITQNLNYIKPYLLKILANVEIEKISVSLPSDYLNEFSVSSIPNDTLSHLIYNEDKLNEDSQEKVDESCKWMINFLKSSAENGILTFEYSDFVSITSDHLQIPREHVEELIKYLDEFKLLQLIEKQFTVFNKLKTVSMRISQMNCEVLMWIVKSLKIDEMLPSERAIIARAKEAFDYKPSTEEWSDILSTCSGAQPQTYRSKSSNSSFSLFSSTSEEEKFRFRVKKYKDPIFNSETHLIYPIDQKWMSYDKYLKSGDILHIKPTRDWSEFTSYFFTYFSTGSYEDKAIPGGRYGCAQFLKHFAIKRLKELSVGKLNYIVQLAIDEDLLRYQKNLLVWTSCLKVGGESEKNGKILKINQSLFSILGKYKDGVSLAQLPGVLNSYIDFHLDLQELGYAKLKDLVLSVPGIQIIKKANKHQFAVLTKFIS